MLPEESKPQFTCENKNFLIKVMFICAAAHPHYDANKQCAFNGRIGCWPLVEYKEAQQKSKNRLAGVLEMKPMTKINADVIPSFM